MSETDAQDPKAAPTPDYLNLAGSIVAAYVTKNSIPASELPALIASIFASLEQVVIPAAAPKPEKLVPAVPIKKSITDDYLICLEDGKRFVSLKRHLSTAYNMSPEEYRAKWGLPRDYPMVAPKYSAKRSELAKTIGLGSPRKGSTEAAKAPAKPSKKAA